MILQFKVWLLKKLLNDVSKHGIDGDTKLAHINEFEDKLLKAVGGEGSINPSTGLVQYKGGGGGSSQTTNELDPNVVPYVRDALSEQQKLYNEGAPEYYAGQTYLDPSKASSDAMTMGMNQARAGNPYLSQAQSTVGGLQSAVNPALAGYKALQGNNITTGTNEALAGFRGLQGGNVNGALAGTQATARGDYLQNNPNFNAVMDSAGKKVTDIYNTATQNTASDVSQAGRYGSNAHSRLQAGNAGHGGSAFRWKMEEGIFQISDNLVSDDGTMLRVSNVTSNGIDYIYTAVLTDPDPKPTIHYSNCELP